MARRGLVFVAVMVIVAIVAVSTESDRHIGNICNVVHHCSRSSAITCTCTEEFRDVSVPESIAEANLKTLKKFEVKDCRSLTLLEGAFRDASTLETVRVQNVEEVHIGAGAFEELQTLTVIKVAALILEERTFEGVRGLKNITITHSYIPLVQTSAFYNITNLQEFKLNQVVIDRIEKNAILIDMMHTGSKAEILQSEIGSIEERGLQIGNAVNFSMVDTDIEKAEPNSIRIGARNSVILRGNKFLSGVDVQAARILYNITIQFTNNTVLNVDISKAINLKMPEFLAIYSLERLVTLHDGNYVICKCFNPALNTTKSFKQNKCVNGCSEATVAAFLQTCQKNSKQTDEGSLKDLCIHSGRSKTESSRSHDEHHFSSVKSGSGTEKQFLYLLPLTAVYFLCVIL